MDYHSDFNIQQLQYTIKCKNRQLPGCRDTFSSATVDASHKYSIASVQSNLTKGRIAAARSPLPVPIIYNRPLHVPLKSAPFRRTLPWKPNFGGSHAG